MPTKVPNSERYLELDAFRIWLAQHDAVILTTTSEWEVLRYQAHNKINILYRNKQGLTWNRALADDWRAFKESRDWSADNTKQRTKNVDLIPSLYKRDGDKCFFCNTRVERNVAIQELLVAREFGGIEHMANLALSHTQCSIEADGLPVVKKVELREKMRKEQNNVD